MRYEQLIREDFENAKDKMQFINQLKEITHSLCPNNNNPVDKVIWVPIEKVQANDYNPNQVAKNEIKLLHTSISHDGYTQPVVIVYDSKIDKYVIIDGFHRYFTMKTNKDIRDLNGGYLPLVVLNKSINDRMASTVRHNRARGKHSITGMSSIVFNMLDNGWEDSAICNELGMEADELVRLKHITGFSKLFEDVNYKPAWKTDKQMEFERKHKDD